ncbi:MAG: class III signal peptide-containing protein [Candidatus Micrarchaeota archaeon]
MDEKAQGTFEYILLVGAAIMLVAIAYMMLKTSALEGGKEQVNQSYNDYLNATNTSGYI